MVRCHIPKIRKIWRFVNFQCCIENITVAYSASISSVLVKSTGKTRAKLLVKTTSRDASNKSYILQFHCIPSVRHLCAQQFRYPDVQKAQSYYSCTVMHKPRAHYAPADVTEKHSSLSDESHWICQASEMCCRDAVPLQFMNQTSEVQQEKDCRDQSKVCIH